MLRTEGGVSLDEIVAVTCWQTHTVRGAMSGPLKKKFGLTITSEKVEGRGRVYSLEQGFGVPHSEGKLSLEVPAGKGRHRIPTRRTLHRPSSTI